ncbi:hypothetical protein B0H11DRAFT_573474 [Mycena galericulata]|nr:hypothetical protein B0H11DRAFT_573474 [Mycena galericulata]
MPPPADVDLADLLGILRLANVEYLFRRALHHLATWYSHRLKNYYRRGTILTHRLDDSGTIVYTDSNTTATHLEVIKVATEVGALWILPVAYYRLCSTGVAAILDSGGAHWKNLSPQQQRICLVSHAPLVGGMLAVHEFFRMRRPSACVHAEKCQLVWDVAVDLLLGEVSLGTTSVLDFWHGDGFRDILTGRADRTPCITAGKEGYKTALVKFWDDLPRMSSLLSWSELEVLRLAAFGLSA